jgi:hypothetical protein
MDPCVWQPSARNHSVSRRVITFNYSSVAPADAVILVYHNSWGCSSTVKFVPRSSVTDYSEAGMSPKLISQHLGSFPTFGTIPQHLGLSPESSEYFYYYSVLLRSRSFRLCLQRLSQSDAAAAFMAAAGCCHPHVHPLQADTCNCTDSSSLLGAKRFRLGAAG